MISIKVEMDRLLLKMKRLSESIEPQSIAEHHKATTTSYLRSRTSARFKGQGDDVTGPWKPLKAYTVEERIRLGFGGTSPILKRTGSLMSWVEKVPPKSQAETYIWPSVTPPNNSHMMYAFIAAQRGRTHPATSRRRIVAVNLQDFKTIRQLLEHKIAVALHA